MWSGTLAEDNFSFSIIREPSQDEPSINRKTAITWKKRKLPMRSYWEDCIQNVNIFTKSRFTNFNCFLKMLFLVSCSERIVHRFLLVSQIERLGGLLGGKETMTVLYTNLTQCHKTVQCFDVVVIWDSTGWKPVLRRVSCFSKCIIVKDF